MTKHKKPRNPNPNTSGLKPNKSPDCTTKPIQISVMVEQDQLDFLDGLKGTRSFNIRCAIRLLSDGTNRSQNNTFTLCQKLKRGDFDD